MVNNMLTEDRRTQIVKLVEENKSASVSELMTLFDASESTIRRDLTELDHKGVITKVHGGAVAHESSILTLDASITERAELNKENKISIAKYAASLITDEDNVYLDAGTTTGLMIDCITARNATFVTNGITQARKLASLGFTVYMPAGQVKGQTEAIIGPDACAYLLKMHFTKCFIGGNGISVNHGCTTPDRQEAAVKEVAILHSKEKYLLIDSSKFEKISSSVFANFDELRIITDTNIPKTYKKYSNIITV